MYRCVCGVAYAKQGWRDKHAAGCEAWNALEPLRQIELCVMGDIVAWVAAKKGAARGLAHVFEGRRVEGDV